MEEERYLCNTCGGAMVFDPKSQQLKCPNCNTAIAIESDKIVQENLLATYQPRTILPEQKQSVTMQCKSCGADMEIPSTVTATKCPYCGESIVMAAKQEAWIIPDGICPFAIDPKTAGILFQKWVSNRKMAPPALKNLYQQGKLMGLYMPAWTFDARGSGPYSAKGGKRRTEHYKDSEGKDQTRTVTDWYSVAGRVDHNFDDVLVSASATVDTPVLKSMGRFKTGEAKPYEPKYMVGFGAERYSVSMENAHKIARDEMKKELEHLAEQEVRGSYDEVRNLKLSPSFSNETWKHLFLPIYSTAYVFNGKTYQVMINGETGSIWGESPTSWQKVILIIAAVVAVIALIVFMMTR